MPRFRRSANRAIPGLAKASTTGIKGQTSGSSLQFGQQLTNYSHLRLMMQAQNNSSLMLNNFTTSIFYRYVWAISRGGKMMRWGEFMLPPICSKHTFIFLAFSMGWPQVRSDIKLQGWPKVTGGIVQHWSVNFNAKPWPRHTSDPSACWWKCSVANQSGKYEKSVREIGFGAGKKSASAAKVWPSDPGFLIQLNWLFCSCKKEDWPFWERSLDGSQFVIIINGLWSLDAESH